AGDDVIYGDFAPNSPTLPGNLADFADIVFGDHGKVTQAALPTTPVRTNLETRILTTGLVERIETSEPRKGGRDTITTAAGDDSVFGGAGADVIDAGEGNNIVLGDHGFIDKVASDGDRSDIDVIGSAVDAGLSDASLGGSDTITTGAGDDI